MGTMQNPHAAIRYVSFSENINTLDMKFTFLGQKVDKLLAVQVNVLQKLNSVSWEICCIEEDIGMLKAKTTEPEYIRETKEKLNSSEIQGLYLAMSNTLADMNRSAQQQAKRLDEMEQAILGLQQLLEFLIKKLKTSRLSVLIIKDQASPKLHKGVVSLKKDEVGHIFRTQILLDKKYFSSLHKNNKKVSVGLLLILLRSVIIWYRFIFWHAQCFKSLKLRETNPDALV